MEIEMNSNKKEIVLEIEEDIKSQIEHDNRKMAYINYMAREKKEYYDVDFVNFYRNGKIIINDKEYRTSSLYLESGLLNDQESLFFVYYAFPQKDLLNQKEKINFKRTNVTEFRASNVFHQIYIKYKNDIKDNILIINEKNITDIDKLVHSFDGTKHTETPETAYGRTTPRYMSQKGDL